MNSIQLRTAPRPIWNAVIRSQPKFKEEECAVKQKISSSTEKKILPFILECVHCILFSNAIVSNKCVYMLQPRYQQCSCGIMKHCLLNIFFWEKYFTIPLTLYNEWLTTVIEKVQNTAARNSGLQPLVMFQDFCWQGDKIILKTQK